MIELYAVLPRRAASLIHILPLNSIVCLVQCPCHVLHVASGLLSACLEQITRFGLSLTTML
jgi:hypothetical protein